MRTVCNENLPVWQKQSDSQNCFKIRLTKLEFGLVKRVALVFVDPLQFGIICTPLWFNLLCDHVIIIISRQFFVHVGTLES